MGSLGSPVQMVSAVIQEDLYEVTLTLSFALAGHAEKQVCSALWQALRNIRNVL